MARDRETICGRDESPVTVGVMWESWWWKLSAYGSLTIRYTELPDQFGIMDHQVVHRKYLCLITTPSHIWGSTTHSQAHLSTVTVEILFRYFRFVVPARKVDEISPPQLEDLKDDQIRQSAHFG